MKKACVCLALSLLCLSFALLAPGLIERYNGDQEIQDLTSEYVTYSEEDPDGSEEEEESPDSVSEGDAMQEESPFPIQCDFEGLKKVNPDIIAWILVPGTQIDYPVCRGNDESYYLTHSATREQNALGSIFVPAQTSDGLTDAHTILYGHNMRSGRMFGELSNYESSDFRNQYPYVYIDTPAIAYTCMIYSTYRTQCDSAVFQTGYLSGSDLYRQWIDETIQDAAYECGIHPDSNAQIFTLSTCVDSGSAKERYVVQCVVTGQIEKQVQEGTK